MGCDIHTSLVEVGKDKSYYWPIAVDILSHRNYALFEILAGVRGDESNAIVPPRGLPSWWRTPHSDNDDYLEGADGGDHSHSWLSIAELREVAIRYAMSDRAYTGVLRDCEAINAICDYADAYVGEGHEAVFVFSFDN